jgi:hypothetical protein
MRHHLLNIWLLPAAVAVVLIEAAGVARVDCLLQQDSLLQAAFHLPLRLALEGLAALVVVMVLLVLILCFHQLRLLVVVVEVVQELVEAQEVLAVAVLVMAVDIPQAVQERQAKDMQAVLEQVALLLIMEQGAAAVLVQ